MDPQDPPSADQVASDYPDDSNVDVAADGRVEMDQEEIDAIIRNKRKVRDPKACYACHRRKVKCDRNLPCDSCVKRDHPELCSYERPTKKRRIALAGTVGQSEAAVSDNPDPSHQTGPNVSVPREHWERINRELQQLRATAKISRLSQGQPQLESELEEGAISGSQSRDEADREGIHAPSNQMGLIHLGSRSILAYMMGLGRSKTTQDTARSLLEENILPKLGLDNESATYPFVDLWSTESSMQDVSGLCKAVPDDDLCNECVDSSDPGTTPLTNLGSLLHIETWRAPSIPSFPTRKSSGRPCFSCSPIALGISVMVLKSIPPNHME